uniref:Uncharacterized protein n=1 Tax=uncultured Verrucomicrobiales bacterium HF0010_05E02 TaxID=710995 RepID=E0XQN9_9BACT|nr:hypothetical protein [uncultured Verrucomicrobiales bacterium HF0010_05E02]
MNSYYRSLKRYNSNLASFEALKYDIIITTNKYREYQQPLNERAIAVLMHENRVDLIFRNALIESPSKLDRTNSLLLQVHYRLNPPSKLSYQSHAQHPQTVYSIRNPRKRRGHTTTSITMGTGDYL